MENAKGYVQCLGKTVPITWERESKKFVYNVRRVFVSEKKAEKSARLFDEKIPKKEIQFFG